MKIPYIKITCIECNDNKDLTIIDGWEWDIVEPLTSEDIDRIKGMEIDFDGGVIRK